MGGRTTTARANRSFFLTAIFLIALQAEARNAQVHVLTLQAALDLASKQNLDILYSRLEAQHAQYDIDIARDPFVPKLTTRSDGVYTSGYPNNVNGHSPSILSAELDRSIYDRVRHYQIAATREQVKSFAISGEGKRENVYYQVGVMFLDVKQFSQGAQVVKNQIAFLQGLTEEVQARVDEGKSLAVERKRAQVDLVQAQQRLASFEADAQYAERSLALALGFPPGDRVEPAQPQTEIQFLRPASETEATDEALAKNKELLRLKASLFAKRIELKSYKASHLPQANLVAQYSLIQKTTYDNYFPQGRVQRNNGEIGADFILPILVGTAPGGHLAQAQTEFSTLQIQIYKVQNQTIAATHRGYQQLHKSEEMLGLLREKLDMATTELSVLRSLQGEGRSSAGDVERASIQRNEEELALRQGEIDVERARLEVLRQRSDLATDLGGLHSEPAPVANAREGLSLGEQQ